ncbi:F-box protein SKIP17 [Heracleum sosnowskyi]|uniref:F-box protein SKIP17 n=1 Tax=Heracleum sosnowskyi TaxID=360622 RepID=A0AAD8HUC3_9APIA|nr:F-box protein SKIP17 [Heracleum sosnowskyi]
MNPFNHRYAAASPPERLDMDGFTKSFTHLSNSSSSSLDFSFDRLVESSPSDEAQCEMIDKAIRIGRVLVEAGLRATRKRDAEHNSRVWPLNSDLTVNVFFWLDTRSVCYTAATCNFFRRCTTDPLCYARINLLTAVPKVDNLVVSTMIQRAGKALRSIKLGLLPASNESLGSSQPLVYSQRNSTNDKRSRQRKELCILTRSCLNSLTIEGGASGARLRCLHLYYIERMDDAALSEVLSACPSLLDLVIVGLHVELRQTFDSVSQHCHNLERLYIESSKTGRYDSLQTATCLALVENCPRIFSFALRGFELQDHIILCLVKGFRYLTSVDFSTSCAFTGGFLRKLGDSAGGNLLEFMFLCDCMHLKKEEVKNFLSAVLAGNFKLLRHLDISNWDGLATEDGRSRSFIPINQLCEARPNFSIRAEFPSLMEFESDEDVVFPSQQSSPTSDASFFMNSGVSSGSEDSQDASFASYGESSDELDFLSH